MQVTMSAEALNTLPEAQRAVYESYPAWATIAFALAVIAGTVGSLLLARAKALALPLLVASVVGVVVQKIHDFIIIDSATVFGSPAVIMSVFVFGVSVLLVWLAHKGKANHWLS